MPSSSSRRQSAAIVRASAASCGGRLLDRRNWWRKQAESVLAVRCGADGLVVGDRPPLDAAELAIVSEAPGSSPELAHEGVGVGDRDATAVGAADMRDRNEARDRVLDQETGER